MLCPPQPSHATRLFSQTICESAVLSVWGHSYCPYERPHIKIASDLPLVFDIRRVAIKQKTNDTSKLFDCCVDDSHIIDGKGPTIAPQTPIALKLTPNITSQCRVARCHRREPHLVLRPPSREAFCRRRRPSFHPGTHKCDI